MADSISFDMQQIHDAGLSFTLAAPRAPRVLSDGVSRLGKHLRERLIANSPVRSGFLAAHWDEPQVQTSGERVTLQIANEASYIRFVLGGTRFMRPNDFVGRTMDQEHEAIERYLSEIGDALIRAIVSGG